jgi:hypothetical protein
VAADCIGSVLPVAWSFSATARGNSANRSTLPVTANDGGRKDNARPKTIMNGPRSQNASRIEAKLPPRPNVGGAPTEGPQLGTRKIYGQEARSHKSIRPTPRSPFKVNALDDHDQKTCSDEPDWPGGSA